MNNLELINKCELELKDIFNEIDQTCLNNSKKVIDAFHKYEINSADLIGTNGYGYNDRGRDKIEEIYADMLIEEDAQFMQYCSDTFFALLNSYYQVNRTKYYFNKLTKRYESEMVV